MKTNRNTATQKRVLLLAPPGCELLELAAFTDVFGWDSIIGSRGIQLLIAGKAEGQITCFDHRLLPDLSWEQINEGDFDALAIPGGFPRWGFFKVQEDSAFTELLKSFIRRNAPIAAVCTGVLLLARTGMLEGRTASIYPGENGRWQKQLEETGMLPSPAGLCIDGELISAASPAYAVEAALALLTRLTSAENGERIRREMGWHE